MLKSFLGLVFVLLHLASIPGLASETKIAIEPYPVRIDRISGKHVWGQKIAHRAFDVELKERIMNVPLFTIQYAGLHHREQSEASLGRVEARAKCIAERLEIAWHLLGKGGNLIVADEQLVVGDDNWETWRLQGQTRPNYAPAPETCPAIFIVHEDLGPQPLRIVTIYKEDLDAFPRGGSPSERVPWTQSELAEYIKSLILAHHLLFEEKSAEISDYESLKMDDTRAGKIFKEIFIRAQEVMVLKQEPELTYDILRDALARISMPQRERLVLLSFRAPRDWGETHR